MKYPKYDCEIEIKEGVIVDSFTGQCFKGLYAVIKTGVRVLYLSYDNYLFLSHRITEYINEN